MRGCFCTDYCQTRLVVGRGYGDYHAGVKARFEAVFEILDDVRVLVGGKNSCLLLSCKKLKRWKNSSLILSRPAKNCTSSMIRRSYCRYFSLKLCTFPACRADT